MEGEREIKLKSYSIIGSYAPIIVMPHLPQVGPGRGFCRGFVSRFVPRVGDLYHVFWYCVCNFCAYEHHYTKALIPYLQ